MSDSTEVIINVNALQVQPIVNSVDAAVQTNMLDFTISDSSIAVDILQSEIATIISTQQTQANILSEPLVTSIIGIAGPQGDATNLADIATSGNWQDLVNKPITFNGTSSVITIAANGDSDFAGDVSANNFSGVSFGINTGDQDMSGFAQTIDISAVGFSNNYADLDNKPTIPPATTPAGATSQIQYNSGGSFAASANFSFDGTRNVILGSSNNAFTIGRDNSVTIGTGTKAVAIGVNNTVSLTSTNSNGAAIGVGNTVNARDSASIGVNNVGSGRNIGFNNKMSQGDGIGRNNIGQGTSIGSACTSGSSGTAIGSSCQATGTYAFCSGVNSIASDVFSFAVGAFANATGFVSQAFGSSVTAAGSQSTAIGKSVQTSAAATNAMIIGSGGSAIVTNTTPNSLQIVFGTSSFLMTDASIAFSFGQELGNDGSVFLPNVSATPATPSAGGVMFVEGGALKYRGSSGTITTIGAA